MHHLHYVRSQGDQVQDSSYSSIVHLYFGSTRGKDPLKQVHLEAIY